MSDPTGFTAFVKLRVGWNWRNYSLRRRKNRGRLLAGIVTDLLAPSSAMLAVFVSQVAGKASAPVSSNAKPLVSAEGQEIRSSVSE